MKKIDPEELLSVADAAKLRGVSRQAINHLIRQNKIGFIQIGRNRFILRQSLESFTPDKGGRPLKPKSENL